MKVKFNKPIQLGSVTYHKGTHEVPDEFSKHWFFLANVQNGSCSVIGKKEKTVEAPAAPLAPEQPPGQSYDAAVNGSAPCEGGEVEAEKEETAKEKKARKQREARAAAKAAKAETEAQA